MSGRIAWTVCALCVGLTGLGLALLALSRNTEASGATLFGTRTTDLAFALVFLTYPVVGAIILSRHPSNRIGWLFCAAGLAIAVVFAAHAWAVYGLLTNPGSLEEASVAGVIQTLGPGPCLILGGLLVFLLFPDGHLPSPRWRIVVWLTTIATAALMIGDFLRPGPLESLPQVTNPIGVGRTGGTAIDVVTVGGYLLLLFCLLSAATSIALRFRRASGVARQQLEWIASAGALLALAVVSLALPLRSDVPGSILTGLGLAAIPVATGVAILKYRLYEIDRIVNRTLVYGAVTALLAGLYFGIVLGLQQVFSGVTRGNDLAIAGSTLAVAALFRPARRRIQAFVDRRFYRRRYNAAQTLVAFSTRLRDEVDLDQLGADLGAVVHETMQPAHLSLWIRPDAGAVTVPVTISGRSGDRKDLR